MNINNYWQPIDGSHAAFTLLVGRHRKGIRPVINLAPAILEESSLATFWNQA